MGVVSSLLVPAAAVGITKLIDMGLMAGEKKIKIYSSSSPVLCCYDVTSLYFYKKLNNFLANDELWLVRKRQCSNEDEENENQPTIDLSLGLNKRGKFRVVENNERRALLRKVVRNENCNELNKSINSAAKFKRNNINYRFRMKKHARGQYNIDNELISKLNAFKLNNMQFVKPNENNYMTIANLNVRPSISNQMMHCSFEMELL